MNLDNINIYSKTNTGIVKMLGEFVKQARLNRNISQEELAVKAGLNRSTIYYFEKGQKGNLDTFVRVLRALDKLHLFEQFQPHRNISPIAIVKNEGKMPQRVSKNRGR